MSLRTFNDGDRVAKLRESNGGRLARGRRRTAGWGKGAIFAVVVLSVPLENSAVRQAPPRTERYLRAEQQFAFPDAEISYGIAALGLTSEYVPDYDLPGGVRQLDEIVARVRELLAAQPDADDPLVRIATINTVLFREYGFHYDMSNFPKQTADKRLLGNLLRRGEGTCANLPDLYYAVAERLGFPIYLVEAPQHAFLRYELPSGKHINIEATSGGGQSLDEDYIAEMEIPKAALDSGTFMRTLSRREALLLLVEERTWHAERAGNFEQVLGLGAFLRRQRPGHAPTFWNSAIWSVVAGRATRELAKTAPSFTSVSDGFFREARAFAARATELGITKPDNTGEYAHRQESIRQTRLGERAAPLPPSERWNAGEEIERLIVAPPNAALDWATAFLKPTSNVNALDADFDREIAQLDEAEREAERSNRYVAEERARTEALVDAVNRLNRTYKADEKARLMNEITALTGAPPTRFPSDPGARP